MTSSATTSPNICWTWAKLTSNPSSCTSTKYGFPVKIIIKRYSQSYLSSIEKRSRNRKALTSSNSCRPSLRRKTKENNIRVCSLKPSAESSKTASENYGTLLEYTTHFGRILSLNGKKTVFSRSQSTPMNDMSQVLSSSTRSGSNSQEERQDSSSNQN